MAFTLRTLQEEPPCLLYHLNRAHKTVLSRTGLLVLFFALINLAFLLCESRVETFWVFGFVFVLGLLYELKHPELHTFLLTFGVGSIWVFNHDTFISMCITATFLLYTMYYNRNRGKVHDYTCIYFIVIVFKLIDIPFSVHFFEAGFYSFLGYTATADIILAFMINGYKSSMMRSLCRVTEPIRQIKQVYALKLLYVALVLHSTAIMCEVYLNSIYDTPLYLYSSFTDIRTLFKALEYYILWAIFIDSLNLQKIQMGLLLKRMKKSGENLPPTLKESS